MSSDQEYDPSIEYSEISKELRNFLKSTTVNAEAERYLTGDPGKVQPSERHKVEDRVIRDASAIHW